MVLAMGTHNGKRMVFMGLEQGNVDRLVAGDPLSVTKETHGGTFPGDLEIMILYGKTKEDIVKQLNALNGGTVRQIDPESATTLQ